MRADLHDPAPTGAAGTLEQSHGRQQEHPGSLVYRRGRPVKQRDATSCYGAVPQLQHNNSPACRASVGRARDDRKEHSTLAIIDRAVAEGSAAGGGGGALLLQRCPAGAACGEVRQSSAVLAAASSAGLDRTLASDRVSPARGVLGAGSARAGLTTSPSSSSLIAPSLRGAHRAGAAGGGGALRPSTGGSTTTAAAAGAALRCGADTGLPSLCCSPCVHATRILRPACCRRCLHGTVITEAPGWGARQQARTALKRMPSSRLLMACTISSMLAPACAACTGASGRRGVNAACPATGPCAGRIGARRLAGALRSGPMRMLRVLTPHDVRKVAQSQAQLPMPAERALRDPA